MRIVEVGSVTHPGRVRRNNEDSYLVSPPLFALADGMGGAQAGELASRLCIDAFHELRPAEGDGPAEERLAQTIGDANRRIVERGRSDPKAAGMGTTVTAALVEGRSVAFGHVGDSRAYLLRGGALQQLSRDHSLVGELLRQGRLTPDEAGAHPQRSVITRALGQADAVEVDTWSVEAADGDVYLICSDGLSDLVDADELAAALGSGGTLERALRSLVHAANAAGGDDNITAIAFRMGDAADEAPAPAGAEAVAAPNGDEEDTLTEADRVPVIRTAPPVRDGVPRLLEPAPPPRPGRSLRAALILLVIGCLAAAAVLASIAGLRYAHFVGVDPKTGDVGVYQGLPIDLGGGHTLYRLTFRSTVNAATLPASQRRRLFDHKLRSDDDAMRIVKALERAQP